MGRMSERCGQVILEEDLKSLKSISYVTTVATSDGRAENLFPYTLETVHGTIHSNKPITLNPSNEQIEDLKRSEFYREEDSRANP